MRDLTDLGRLNLPIEFWHTSGSKVANISILISSHRTGSEIGIHHRQLPRQPDLRAIFVMNVSRKRDRCARNGVLVPGKTRFCRHGCRFWILRFRLFFVETDNPTINASRFARRVIEFGHDVPIAKIVDRYKRSITNLAKVLPLINRCYIYDNCSIKPTYS